LISLIADLDVLHCCQVEDLTDGHRPHGGDDVE
jgi:hypothetical protein